MAKKYVTKDSGKRVSFPSGMNRDTADNKARFDLLFPLGMPYHETLLYRVAMLMDRGKVKYGERNWENANSVEELNRFKASAWRHFVQAMSGEDDEDHFAAVVFNLNAIIYLTNKLKVNVLGTENRNLMDGKMIDELNKIDRYFIGVDFANGKDKSVRRKK